MSKILSSNEFHFSRISVYKSIYEFFVIHIQRFVKPFPYFPSISAVSFGIRGYVFVGVVVNGELYLFKEEPVFCIVLDSESKRKGLFLLNAKIQIYAIPVCILGRSFRYVPCFSSRIEFILFYSEEWNKFFDFCGVNLNLSRFFLGGIIIHIKELKPRNSLFFILGSCRKIDIC